MAGSWYEIKHKKNKADNKRGVTFTKLAQAITMAVKQGGGDPTMNAALELVLRKAKTANMTNDIIERAIKKGKGESLGESELVELLYEGYAPLGIPMLVVALTDNPNRTVAHVRHIFSKYGGKYAESGSVSFQFQRKGIFQIRLTDDLESSELALMDAGVEDYVFLEPSLVEAVCPPTELGRVNTALKEAGLSVEEAKLGYVPLQSTVIESEEDMQTLANFIDMMEDNDDIQQIYSTISMKS